MKRPKKTTRRIIKRIMRILYFQLSQMMYWNVFSGFVIHKNDVSGRLKQKQTCRCALNSYNNIDLTSSLVIMQYTAILKSRKAK